MASVAAGFGAQGGRRVAVWPVRRRLPRKVVPSCSISLHFLCGPRRFRSRPGAPSSYEWRSTDPLSDAVGTASQAIPSAGRWAVVMDVGVYMGAMVARVFLDVKRQYGLDGDPPAGERWGDNYFPKDCLLRNRGRSISCYLFSVSRPDRYLWMTLERSVW